VAPGLARHGRVLALDLAGFGLTPPHGRSCGVTGNWRMLHGFLEALELPPVVLVGSSLGGMIAMIQCAHAPSSVEALVLVDAAFPRGRSIRAQPSPWIAAAFALYANQAMGEQIVTARARRLGPERLVRETIRLCTVDPDAVDPLLVEAMIELAHTREGFDYGNRAFMEAARSIFRAQVRASGYRAVVRAARAPALVIHGAQDRLVPLAAAREAVRGHVDWDLVVFEDLGHIPMMEAPHRWLAAVGTWLMRRRHAAGRTANARGETRLVRSRRPSGDPLGSPRKPG
jgi:pimeloyl-ACP methyl ester carboxylesterase